MVTLNDAKHVIAAAEKKAMDIGQSLGLGTGLGSALITDGVLVPMELAHLRYRKGRTYEDYVGLPGLDGM